MKKSYNIPFKKIIENYTRVIQFGELIGCSAWQFPFFAYKKKTGSQNLKVVVYFKQTIRSAIFNPFVIGN